MKSEMDEEDYPVEYLDVWDESMVYSNPVAPVTVSDVAVQTDYPCIIVAVKTKVKTSPHKKSPTGKAVPDEAGRSILQLTTQNDLLTRKNSYNQDNDFNYKIEESFNNFVDVSELEEPDEFMEESHKKVSIVDEITMKKEEELSTLEYQCHKCMRKFSSLKSLELHFKRKHLPGISKYSCDKCKKYYHSYPGFWQHMKKHKPNQPKYPCTECDYVFGVKSNLTRHLETIHNPIATFPCKHCVKSFDTKEILSIHRKACRRLRFLRHQCDICSRTFTRNTNLQQHKLEVHTDRKLPCENAPMCQVQFKSTKSLQRHLKESCCFLQKK